MSSTTASFVRSGLSQGPVVVTSEGPGSTMATFHDELTPECVLDIFQQMGVDAPQPGQIELTPYGGYGRGLLRCRGKEVAVQRMPSRAAARIASAFRHSLLRARAAARRASTVRAEATRRAAAARIQRCFRRRWRTAHGRAPARRQGVGGVVHIMANTFEHLQSTLEEPEPERPKEPEPEQPEERPEAQQDPPPVTDGREKVRAPPKTRPHKEDGSSAAPTPDPYDGLSSEDVAEVVGRARRDRTDGHTALLTEALVQMVCYVAVVYNQTAQYRDGLAAVVESADPRVAKFALRRMQILQQLINAFTDAMQPPVGPQVATPCFRSGDEVAMQHHHVVNRTRRVAYVDRDCLVCDTVVFRDDDVGREVQITPTSVDGHAVRWLSDAPAAEGRATVQAVAPRHDGPVLVRAHGGEAVFGFDNVVRCGRVSLPGALRMEWAELPRDDEQFRRVFSDYSPAVEPGRTGRGEGGRPGTGWHFLYRESARAPWTSSAQPYEGRREVQAVRLPQRGAVAEAPAACVMVDFGSGSVMLDMDSLTECERTWHMLGYCLARAVGAGVFGHNTGHVLQLQLVMMRTLRLCRNLDPTYVGVTVCANWLYNLVLGGARQQQCLVFADSPLWYAMLTGSVRGGGVRGGGPVKRAGPRLTTSKTVDHALGLLSLKDDKRLTQRRVLAWLDVCRRHPAWLRAMAEGGG